jgi:protein-disulfide isomerase
MRLAALLVALTLCGCSQAQAPDEPQAAADAAPVAVQTRYTKEQFAAHVVNLTKAQVSAEFGSPQQVHDSNDTWFYASPPVYDAQAGTQTSAWIRFAGIDGSDDFVADVKFD